MAFILLAAVEALALVQHLLVEAVLVAGQRVQQVQTLWGQVG